MLLAHVGRIRQGSRVSECDMHLLSPECDNASQGNNVTLSLSFAQAVVSLKCLAVVFDECKPTECSICLECARRQPPSTDQSRECVVAKLLLLSRARNKTSDYKPHFAAHRLSASDGVYQTALRQSMGLCLTSEGRQSTFAHTAVRCDCLQETCVPSKCSKGVAG